MSSPYYDSYIERQIKSGINNRIYSLYKRLKKLGLGRDMKILEIGCGIGALTYLLSKKIKTGTLEAVDFSEKSVAYAAKYIANHNVSFTCADILEFNPKCSSFDYILLFDVLEHIPHEKHAELFHKIHGWMHNDSLLLINLPNPEYTIYEQQNNPANLQEIDQPVYFHQLSGIFKKNQLQILNMETWPVWVQEEYQFYTIRKEREFEEIVLENQMNMFQKIRNRLILKFRKVRFNYPVK